MFAPYTKCAAITGEHGFGSKNHEVVALLLEHALLPKYKTHTEKVLWRPIFQALETVSKLTTIPVSQNDWVLITPKSIYKDLKQQQVTAEVIPSQKKWVDKEGLRIDWDKLWKVIQSLKYSFRDLHGALYYLTTRCFIIPTKDKYEDCVYCPQSNGVDVDQKEWSPVHAIFHCSRFKHVWQHVSKSILNDSPQRAVSMQKIFEICQEIPLSRGKPKLTLTQLLVLCLITEFIHWVRAHKSGDTKQTLSHLSGDEFQYEMLSKIWRRVRKYRQETDTPTVGIG